MAMHTDVHVDLMFYVYICVCIGVSVHVLTFYISICVFVCVCTFVVIFRKHCKHVSYIFIFKNLTRHTFY